MLELIGIKPTYIHLGHLLSVFQYARNNKDAFFLIADYHKFSSAKNYKEVDIVKNYLCNFMIQNNFKFICQSDFPEVYGNLFFYFSSKSNINALNKIFKINYYSNENNLMKFIYPVLMLIDILLFQPCIVITSADQIHNTRYIKEQIKKLCTNKCKISFKNLDIKIKSITGEDKMSTSNNSNKIFVQDNYEQIFSVIKKTPSSANLPDNYNNLNDCIKNLLSILGIIKNINPENLFDEKKFTSYLELKKYVADEIFNYIQSYIHKEKDSNMICNLDIKNIVYDLLIK